MANPQEDQGLRVVVIGGGNSAVEAAVDLVAWRDDDRIRFRNDAELNRVTMLVRGADFKTDVKFDNKQQLFLCGFF